MCGSWAGWSFSQSVANGWAAEDNEECGAATCWGTMVKPQGNRCWVGGDGERPTDPLCGCGKGLTLWGESICCLMLGSMMLTGHTLINTVHTSRICYSVLHLLEVISNHSLELFIHIFWRFIPMSSTMFYVTGKWDSNATWTVFLTYLSIMLII